MQTNILGWPRKQIHIIKYVGNGQLEHVPERQIPHHRHGLENDRAAQSTIKYIITNSFHHVEFEEVQKIKK